MENSARLKLIRQLEELIESVSRKERRNNNALRGKTTRIVKLTNYLKALKNQNRSHAYEI